MSTVIRSLGVLGLTICTGAAWAAEVPQQITVSAGKHNRRQTVVSFAMPAEAAKTSWRLRDEAGNVLPLQATPRGQALFVLENLPAGQSRTYRLEQGQTPQGITTQREGNVVRFLIDGRTVLVYQGDKSALPPGYEPQFQRGGYIQSVYSPAGRLLTDDYPPNHKHHHAIWSPWTKTVFEGRHPDFWNMGAKTGTVEFVAIDDVWSGPVAAGLRARHRFVDLTALPEPKAALNETWDITVFRAAAAYHQFDLDIHQTCASESPLVLPRYHYGGLGVRGNRQWDGKANAVFLTSEGKERSNGNETRARWCYMGGKVDGNMAGLAVLCHPSNFRAPQPLRIHPTEPFVGCAPEQLGDFAIEPGKPYIAKYRFIAVDGPADRDELERLWTDYADPPTVVLK